MRTSLSIWRLVRVAGDLIAGVTATIAMLHEEEESAAFLRRVGLPHLGIASSGRLFGDTRLIAPPVRDTAPRVGALRSDAAA